MRQVVTDMLVVRGMFSRVSLVFYGEVIGEEREEGGEEVVLGEGGVAMGY